MAAYALPGAIPAGFESFRAFEQDAKDLNYRKTTGRDAAS
jgi:hypothetical protein